MAVAIDATTLSFSEPIDIGSQAFADAKYDYYRWMREEAPVCRAKVSVVKLFMVSRYEDCLDLLKDPRFVRNRSTATGGGSRLPFPAPRSIRLLAKSMIVEDDPEHRRLRGLVNKAFTPRAVARLEPRIESLTHELIDRAKAQGSLDLMPAYCLPIPVTVISELVGVPDGYMDRFREGIRVLTDGFSGWSIVRSLFFDMPGVLKLVREMIDVKRREPQDDILTALIEAEEEGDRLTEDEIVSLVFLLVGAGYETTVHLIANGVIALLDHPDQLDRLRAEPELLEPAVEEILRYRGPVHGTKMHYATEDVTIHGVTIPKGKPVMPALGAANHDPEAFEKPEVFDVGRTPNRHLGFGFGNHFCLGAQLARMETRVALRTLLDRCPDLRLAVPSEAIELQAMPGWHRHKSLPVHL